MKTLQRDRVATTARKPTTNLAAVIPVKNLKLSSIRVDGGTQSRAGLVGSVVIEYTERMLLGDVFPPLDVFHDGKSYWLADGFHRVQAARDANLKEFPAKIYSGTDRDALLHSIASNATHGLRRSIDDRRNALIMLFKDDEWSQRSNMEIAKFVSVSESFVRQVKRDLLNLSSSSTKIERYERISPEVLTLAAEKLQNEPTRKIVNRGGKTFVMDVANVGKSTPKKVEPPIETRPTPPPIVIRHVEKKSPELDLTGMTASDLAAKVKAAFSPDAVAELCVELIGTRNSSLYPLFLRKLERAEKRFVTR